MPFPGVFAPQAEFARHGGPAAFGLARLNDHGTAIPAEPSRTLLVKVSHTDVDIIDPGEIRPHDLIGGVHYSEGVGPWRQAALSTGMAVLLTGPTLPGFGDTGPVSLRTAYAGLWGAIVPVQAA